MLKDLEDTTMKIARSQSFYLNKLNNPDDFARSKQD